MMTSVTDRVVDIRSLMVNTDYILFCKNKRNILQVFLFHSILQSNLKNLIIMISPQA